MQLAKIAGRYLQLDRVNQFHVDEHEDRILIEWGNGTITTLTGDDALALIEHLDHQAADIKWTWSAPAPSDKRNRVVDEGKPDADQ